ncbi:hypothetical protein KY359_03575 [Candidatus Woesearchaeota archaeon]|nr:hypothetical protein [Candidatus Woesearchaeota archaeon]
MIRYTLGQNIIFVILALISALALLSQHMLIATIFFAIAILFIIFEHDIYAYVKSA